MAEERKYVRQRLLAITNTSDYDLWMDSIAGLLDGPRARSAFVLRASTGRLAG
jgi:hypothetical protein